VDQGKLGSHARTPGDATLFVALRRVDARRRLKDVVDSDYSASIDGGMIAAGMRTSLKV
jgi:hypothetical protein